MKKTFNIKGMHCNSCEHLIESSLKDRVNSISVNYKKDSAEIDFDNDKISEKEIKATIEKLGYSLESKESEKEQRLEEKMEEKMVEERTIVKEDVSWTNKLGWIFLALSVIMLILVVYKFSGFKIPELSIPQGGDNVGLLLLFVAGILTGFHCIAMCGGFVVSYTGKNAINGHKGFTQHVVYGGSKLLSYTVIGGIFGLIGGFVAFSIGLRGWISILAGLFMIFYSLSMFGIKFFRKFQFNPKFLTRAASNAGKSAKGPYTAPMVTGLLNGLFIACGPLQAMYLYAVGTGSLFGGASSLFAFGLGTLPVMLGFGSLTSVISNRMTKKILKVSALIVLILGLIMLNRGLSLTGSNYSYDAIKANIFGGGLSASSTNAATSVIINGVQEVNMGVDASGYSPRSFVIKQGVPVKWNVNVKQLTGCNQELVLAAYNVDVNLKEGMNVIEFTPTKSGTLTFTCGMGMLRGSFIVSETGEASQQEIAAATPAAGGSCGGSGGGCGCGG